MTRGRIRLTPIVVLLSLLTSHRGSSQELTHAAVRYGERQEVMDIYAGKSDLPTPVYLWGHAKGMNYKMIPKKIVKQCQRLGITFVSIEANDIEDVVGSQLRHKEPWNKALDFIIDNADQYNLDASNVFIGGRSLGSIGSFPVAMNRHKELRGLYSMQAIPNRGEQAAPLVHKESPPCFFVFKTAQGSNNHDPIHGMMVRDAYERFNISSRFSMRTEVVPNQWFDWFFEFVENNIQEAGSEDLDPRRFAKAIARFEDADRTNTPKKGGTVIVGSSSVRRMKADVVLPGVPLIQRGVGGAHFSDINHFIEQIVLKHEPSRVVIFCGGNDLWRGHSIREVREDFQYFCSRLFERVPSCELTVLAIRPSPKRKKILHKVLRMNLELERLASQDPRIEFLRDSCDRFLDNDDNFVRLLFADDNQHMSDKGYEVWSEILLPSLTSKN